MADMNITLFPKNLDESCHPFVGTSPQFPPGTGAWDRWAWSWAGPGPGPPTGSSTSCWSSSPPSCQVTPGAISYILLVLMYSSAGPVMGQGPGLYTLDINSKAGEGIFVTYFQVWPDYLLPLLISCCVYRGRGTPRSPPWPSTTARWTRSSGPRDSSPSQSACGELEPLARSIHNSYVGPDCHLRTCHMAWELSTHTWGPPEIQTHSILLFW